MKTPITLITGYLGAGKTTLLRSILDNADRKIAVLMNEFGKIAIDSKVVKGKNVDMIELKGGCVCCSLTGEFEAAIKEIKEKIDPELIIIETTGVAEPDAIIDDLSTLEGVRLDATVTVVDADAMKRFPSLGFTGRVQIEMADVIILNKTDLVDDGELVKIEDLIKGINPRAGIIRTTNCLVDAGLILDMNVEKVVGKREHNHHIEEAGLSHLVYRGGRMEKEKLENLFYNLPSDIVRAKGFVVTESGNFLMNFVFGRFDFEEFPAEKTELVFIGRNMNQHEKKILDELGKCETGRM